MVNIRNTTVVLTLCLMPLSYLGIINIIMSMFLFEAAESTLFILYNAPFWFLLAFIIGVELYRRKLSNQLYPDKPVYYFIMAGGLLMSVVGIIISPVGPKLISQEALLLVTSSLLISAIAGLFINHILNRKQQIKE